MSSSSSHSVPDCCTAIESELLNSDQNPDFRSFTRPPEGRCNNLHQNVPLSISLPQASFFHLIVDLPSQLLFHYSHQACYAPLHSSSILLITANKCFQNHRRHLTMHFILRRPRQHSSDAFISATTGTQHLVSRFSHSFFDVLSIACMLGCEVVPLH